MKYGGGKVVGVIGECAVPVRRHPVFILAVNRRKPQQLHKLAYHIKVAHLDHGYPAEYIRIFGIGAAEDHALENILRNSAELSPAAAESAAEPDWRSELASFALTYGLTPRETEICSYLVRGRSAKHIAEELVISENTVWSHVKNVYAKTGAAGKNALIELFEKSAMGE